MKTRKSKVFGNYNETENDIILKVITRFPKKWVLIDTETSQIYNGTENNEIGKNWKKTDDRSILKKINVLIKEYL